MNEHVARMLNPGDFEPDSPEDENKGLTMRKTVMLRLLEQIEKINEYENQDSPRGTYYLDYVKRWNGERERGYYLVYRDESGYSPSHSSKMYSRWLHGELIGCNYDDVSAHLNGLLRSLIMRPYGWKATNCRKCGYRFRLYRTNKEERSAVYAQCPNCEHDLYIVQDWEISVDDEDLPKERWCIHCGKDLSHTHKSLIRVTRFGETIQGTSRTKNIEMYCDECFPAYQADMSNPHD